MKKPKVKLKLHTDQCPPLTKAYVYSVHPLSCMERVLRVNGVIAVYGIVVGRESR